MINIIAMKKHILWCLALVTLGACSEKKAENAEKEGVETVLPSQLNEVTVMKLAKKDFNHELVSNGKSVPSSRRGTRKSSPSS